jgi:hypothetical protein
MRSVADALREESQHAVARLSIAERMQLALRLGEQSLELYMAYHDVDRARALKAFRARTQAGRRSCRCLQD